MKIITRLLILLLLPAGMQGQGIVDGTVSPPNPTTLDTIYFNTELWLPSGPCWRDHMSINNHTQQIDIQSGFNSGMLTVICNHTESHLLGMLPAGIYTINYWAFYPWPQYTWSDSLVRYFTVSPVTDLPDQSVGSRLKIYPNPSRAQFSIEVPAAFQHQATLIDIHDLAGRQVFHSLQTLDAQPVIITTSLPPGIYSIRLHNDRSGSLQARLFLQ